MPGALLSSTIFSPEEVLPVHTGLAARLAFPDFSPFTLVACALETDAPADSGPAGVKIAHSGWMDIGQRLRAMKWIRSWRMSTPGPYLGGIELRSRCLQASARSLVQWGQTSAQSLTCSRQYRHGLPGGRASSAQSRPNGPKSSPAKNQSTGRPSPLVEAATTAETANMISAKTSGRNSMYISLHSRFLTRNGYSFVLAGQRIVSPQPAPHCQSDR